MHPVLNLPVFQLSMRTSDDQKTEVFDPVRKKFVRLTSEEWVRQHLIRYLSEMLHHPYSHMVVEKTLTLNRLTKRADILIYDQTLSPAFLIECKAPGVAITQEVFEQAARYNLVCKVPWLMVSNGRDHHVAYIDHERQAVLNLDHIPAYEELRRPPENQPASSY